MTPKYPKENVTYDLLGRCLEDSIANVSVDEIYNHPSHNFKISGDKYRGGCPFHHSKSGTSFSITASNKLFYCHGCSFGGSPIEYLYSLKVGHWQKPRGKDFVDTVRDLASLSGVSFPEQKLSPEQIEQTRKWEQRRSILQATSEICQEMLWSDKPYGMASLRGIEARNYLTEQRGVSEAGIKDLGLGFFSSYDDVVQDLQNRGFELSEIKCFGLKALEGYITYPWLDANNRPLTIYGRWHTQVPPEGKPKTIALAGKSTKRSPLYLDRALKARHAEIILVEGVNDAALAQSLGLTNVCAYVAASCSSEQIETLKRKGINKVFLCGDPDSAGDNGTVSNLNRMTQAEISVYVAPKLPNNLDPDEFLLKYGVAAWQKQIDNAEHGFRWQAKRLIQQCGIDNDGAKDKLNKLAVNWTHVIPSSLHKELDTFFWSEIDRQTGAISSGKLNDFFNPLGTQQQNKLHPMSETTVTEFDGAEELKSEIQKLIEAGTSESNIEIAIPELAKYYDRSPSDIRRLYKAIEIEIDRDEDRDSSDREINNLLEISQEDIELVTYIPAKLARPLAKLAVYLGVNNASLLTTLLTTSASLLPISTNLKLIEATDFYAYPILYSGICAESGSGKSPLMKVFINPLSRLQQEEEARYKDRLKIYEEEYHQWKKSKDIEIEAPVRPKPPREYIVTDATSEAIAFIQNNQPNNGFLGCFDELTALIGLQNAYRGGKGADAEKILSGRDGTGFKINRAGGTRISCTRSGYSILGGIQPDILKKHMGDFSDPSGFWARFIWVNLPIKKKTFPDTSINLEIDELLYNLYQQIGTISNSFELSSQAQAIFKEWYERSEELKLAEPKQALRAVYSKSQRLSGELALLLHCITHSLDQKEPSQEIESETMQIAVQLTNFYINQVRLIHANSNTCEDNASSLNFRIIDLSHRKGWIKARDVQNGIRSFKKTSPNRIRSLFRELETNGYGTTEGEGNKLTWKAKSVDAIDS